MNTRRSEEVQAGGEQQEETTSSPPGECRAFRCVDLVLPSLAFRYGEIVNINLVRDKKTGKSKGFCFICYEDQRSTILSVDNLNGIKVTPPPPTAPAVTSITTSNPGSPQRCQL